MGTEQNTVYDPKPWTIKCLDKEIGDTYLMSQGTFTSVPNPYKRSQMIVDGKVFDVDYYVTGLIQNDSEVTDEVLSPLVYDAGSLIGWGWQFVAELESRGSFSEFKEQ